MMEVHLNVSFVINCVDQRDCTIFEFVFCSPYMESLFTRQILSDTPVGGDQIHSPPRLVW